MDLHVEFADLHVKVARIQEVVGFCVCRFGDASCFLNLEIRPAKTQNLFLHHNGFSVLDFKETEAIRNGFAAESTNAENQNRCATVLVSKPYIGVVQNCFQLTRLLVRA